MKRALAVVALLAILPSAHAQDKAKGEFTHSGEFRLRDTWNINQKANKDSQPNSNNALAERFKLDLGFKATEKLSANLTLLNSFNWGEATGTALNIHNGDNGNGDFLAVNQAYASWMFSDDVSLKFGRMNYQIADGSLISTNEWEATPYSFEGILGNYEAEFGKFQLFTFKFRELGNGTGTATPNAAPTASDAERNVYGLNFDLKTMPEIIKNVNVHVLKDSSDAVAGDTNLTANGNPGRDMMRYGANASFMFANIVDFKAWYEMMNGKYHLLANNTANKTDITATGSMMQFEVGGNFPALMASRIFVKWHKDTGTKDSSDAADKVQAYDPYFNEQHCSAGCMDIFGWGNLTFIEIGATAKPMDSTEVGISYWILSKTEAAGDSTNAATRPASGVSSGSGIGLGDGTNKSSTKLGNEIDLWAEHHYSSNLATIFRISQFMPGDVYKGNGGVQKDTITQIFAQGKLTF